MNGSLLYFINDSYYRVGFTLRVVFSFLVFKRTFIMIIVVLYILAYSHRLGCGSVLIFWRAESSTFLVQLSPTSEGLSNFGMALAVLAILVSPPRGPD